MPRRFDDETDRALAQLLNHQAGVISRRQLVALGVSDSMIRARLTSPLWQRGYPGTYIAHNGQVSYTSRVWSALLYAGHGALASYSTSAYLHGLVKLPPGNVHVTVDSGRRVVRQSGLVVHLSNRAAEQAEPQSVPPRMTIEETVLDLATAQSKPDGVVGVLTDACRSRKVTSAQLQLALRLRKKMPHRRLVIEVLAATADGVESVLEWRYLRDVERAHGLPRGKRQLTRRRDGRREFVDVRYLKYKVIIELDGEIFHVGEQRGRDKARDNAAAARGEITLRYGWTDTTVTPCATAWQIGEVLRQRGWNGVVRHCGRCRASGVG